MKLLFCLLFAVCAAGSLGLAQAETWPDRPIRWVVPTAAGGPLDGIGRQVAQETSKRLGQPIIIENRPGAGGSIGAAVVAKAEPDGYTFLFSQADSLINAVALIKDLPYDPRRDFSLVTQASQTGAVLMANPDVKGTTLAEVLNAEGNSPALSYGSWGPGSYTHILGETLSRRSGAPLIHVPYKGGAPAIQDFLGKQIQLAFAPANLARQFAEKGQAKLLAISGTRRSELLPELPTFAEQGFAEPIFQVGIWFGLSAPSGTPDAVIERMYESVAAAMREPAIQKFIADGGGEVMASTPQAFRAAFEQEFELVNQTIQQAGVAAK
ncbi:MAG: tripartite tricarboxylate transporter substrate binding protein [Pigmentiphaga sp.]|nr:tripartite tricarboxylate transporter substrate binding protein [Pigmentiphaga sp.]